MFSLAKDMPQYSNHTSPHTRSKVRVSIPRASTSIRTESVDDSTGSSPEPTELAHSPDPTPTSTRSSSRESDSEPIDLDDDREPASGPQRPRSVAGGKAEKEKRKRSRVTPEQLVHLEQFFAIDRSPPAARRREISERLGMQERQTQIWFQNR
jgi:regulatory protein PHO2